MALGVLGGAGVIASPFLLVLGLKARRTTRRRNAAVVRDAVSGGWKDIVDRARDLGFPASQCETRREAAARMQEAYPEVPIMPTARLMDSALYGPNQLAPAASEETWRQVDQIKRGMLRQASRRLCDEPEQVLQSGEGHDRGGQGCLRQPSHRAWRRRLPDGACASVPRC